MLLGPTASGKTDWAIRLSQALECEIVSCDSRQVYRYLDIGTAKPTPQEQQLVKHWMVDIAEPDQQVSCFRYARETEELIRRRWADGKNLFICGGSGLYFKALSEGIGPSVEPNMEFRTKYRDKARLSGYQSIFEELRGIDPLSASLSCPSNVQRNIRALEVYHATGVPLSELKKNARGPAEMDFFIIVLMPPRQELYLRIERRVDAMVKNGLFEEFKALRGRGYDETSPGMHCLGYKEFFAVEKGLVPFRSAVDSIKINTRHYAKRQVTWFKHQLNGPVLLASGNDSLADTEKTLKEFLRR